MNADGGACWNDGTAGCWNDGTTGCWNDGTGLPNAGTGLPRVGVGLPGGKGFSDMPLRTMNPLGRKKSSPLLQEPSVRTWTAPCDVSVLPGKWRPTRAAGTQKLPPALKCELETLSHSPSRPTTVRGKPVSSQNKILPPIPGLLATGVPSCTT